MNELAKALQDLVARYTVFPGPIVNAQCKHIGKSPATITREDLPRLAPYIAKAVALFANPEKAKELEVAIGRL